jgi:hypothetical protein
MQSERVIISIVSTVVAAAIVVAVVISAAVRAFGSLLLGRLIPNVEVVIIATPIILRLRRHLLVVFALHALDACQPSNGRRDLLSFDGVARCDSSGRDTPSATDAGDPLDIDG